MQSIQGKIAWITGAGTGIGRAAAFALAEAGATVILSGRRVPQLEAVAGEIAAKGGKAEVRALDIADAAAVDTVAEQIMASHGRLDLLVNSAGVNATSPSVKYESTLSASVWPEERTRLRCAL